MNFNSPEPDVSLLSAEVAASKIGAALCTVQHRNETCFVVGGWCMMHGDFLSAVVTIRHLP